MDTQRKTQRTDVETTTMFLKARERNLQHLAQSPHCAARPQAELELGKVRDEIAALYVKQREPRATS